MTTPYSPRTDTSSTEDIEYLLSVRNKKKKNSPTYTSSLILTEPTIRIPVRGVRRSHIIREPSPLINIVTQAFAWSTNHLSRALIYLKAKVLS